MGDITRFRDNGGEGGGVKIWDQYTKATMDSEYSQDYSSSRITKALTSILKRNYTQNVFSS